MKTRKATHIGTCQLCGNRHKLPNGRIATHGYTRGWGIYQGECKGSGCYPLETSTALLELEIQSGERFLVENPECDPPAGFNLYASNTEPVEHRLWRSTQRCRKYWNRELPKLKHIVANWKPGQLIPVK